MLNVNATLSQNRIKNHTAYYDLYDNLDNYGWNGQVAHDLGNTPISYSPNMTAMGSLTYTPINRLYLNIIGQYVGKQYLDNTGNDEKAIDDYFVTNISAGYTLPKTGFGTIALQVIVNNLFSHKYIANGWASTDQFEDGSSVNWIGYYPQATRNLLVRATISF